MITVRLAGVLGVLAAVGDVESATVGDVAAAGEEGRVGCTGEFGGCSGMAVVVRDVSGRAVLGGVELALVELVAAPAVES